MRVTSKGQVTIPQAIRIKLNITPASEVDFVVNEDDRVYIVKVERDDAPLTQFSKLRGVATVEMTTEEIMALTRAET